jgi:hypothetical protein
MMMLMIVMIMMMIEREREERRTAVHMGMGTSTHGEGVRSLKYYTNTRKFRSNDDRTMMKILDGTTGCNPRTPMVLHRYACTAFVCSTKS